MKKLSGNIREFLLYVAAITISCLSALWLLITGKRAK